MNLLVEGLKTTTKKTKTKILGRELKPIFIALQMDPLHKKVIFRTLGFFFMWCLSSWFFVLVEHTEENDVEVKRKILQSTFDSMASKYNMSIQDFNNFSNMAYEALSEPKRQWTYNAAMRFVFQVLTTIGKCIIACNDFAK